MALFSLPEPLASARQRNNTIHVWSVWAVEVLGNQAWLVSARLSLLSSWLCFSPLASADHFERYLILWALFVIPT